MSEAAVATSPRISLLTAPPARERLFSLDLFRGLTIAAMILVNDPGEESAAYWPLHHARWNGWTPTDLVFPFFVFIVGVAMVFSFSSRLERGEHRMVLLKHILWRGLVLFAIGLLLNGLSVGYDPGRWRVYGVLQRIAICYVLTAALELWSGWRTQAIILGACLAGYWILMRYVPVPGFGVPGHDVPLLDPDRNIAAWLDRKLLMGHLYERTRDPEGVLSTIPALATCLAGLLTGKWLRRSIPGRKQALAMLMSGAGLVIIGRIWHIWFPINKKLWTSSYVLFTAGMALLVLAVCYWLTDVKRRRGAWLEIFRIFGKNAIAAYVFSEVLATFLYVFRVHDASGTSMSLHAYVYSRVFAALGPPGVASLTFSIAYVALCWVVMAVLYHKRIFLKV